MILFKTPNAFLLLLLLPHSDFLSGFSPMMLAVVEAAQTHRHSVSDVSVSDESTFDSCGSDSCSLEGVDLESGVMELKKKVVVHLSKVERICRICHMGFEGGGLDSSGLPIDLGCSCKGDLGAAHKQCAETWFKIKGDTICEICGVVAFNIVGEQINEANGAIAPTSPSTPPAASVIMVETRTMWHGRRIMNFLLVCMIIAFVISWLFHFKIL